MPDANQSSDGSCPGSEVAQFTERRRLQLVEERVEQFRQMCFGVYRNLFPHPTELGDLDDVSPTGTSRAKSDPRYNDLYRFLMKLAERWTEGADRQDLLEAAIVPLSFLQTIFALDGEEVDVPDAIQRTIDRLAETMQVTTEVIMDGELTPDEKELCREVLRALEAAAREGRTAISQTPHQTSLWPARANGPRT